MVRAIALATLLLAASGGVFGQESLRKEVVKAERVGPTKPKPSRVISRAHQPVGPRHKASAFAPRHTNQRVFGAPIQGPIVHSAPAAKKPAPKKPAPK